MTDRTDDLLDEIVRLLVVAARDGHESQAESIALLAKAGFAPQRIADLLGTTVGTVRAAQDRIKKAKK